MKRKTTIFILALITISLSAQNRNRESWSFGIGVSNHTMAGDHRSIGTGLSNGADDNSVINLGGYLYVDKMFNPAFGMELKGFYTTMSGAAQELTNGYLLPPDAGNVPLRTTNFEGNAYGAELSVIINFSNLAEKPYRTKPRRWNLAGYLGMGVQRYDSQLFDNATGNVLVDFGDNPSDDKIANSVYYTAAFGVKYKLSKNFDIEFRPSVNLNEEDHLDAAKSNKQQMEVFYQTNLGLVFKINDKEHDNYIWQGEQNKIEEKTIEEKPNFDKMVNDAVDARIALLPKYDTDRDTDKDGFKDTVDGCPLRYSKTNGGCPGDADKDGVLDDLDLCPDEFGPKNNLGCPRPDAIVATNSVIQNVGNTNDYVGEHVYFNLNGAWLSPDATNTLNNIVLYANKYPNSTFEIQGNTDKGGSETYNQNLSERRANSVKNYLVSRGVNENNLIIIGNGERLPKFEDLEINRNNRRVDIILRN